MQNWVKPLGPAFHNISCFSCGPMEKLLFTPALDNTQSKYVTISWRCMYSPVYPVYKGPMGRCKATTPSSLSLNSQGYY